MSNRLKQKGYLKRHYRILPTPSIIRAKKNTYTRKAAHTAMQPAQTLQTPHTIRPTSSGPHRAAISFFLETLSRYPNPSPNPMTTELSLLTLFSIPLSTPASPSSLISPILCTFASKLLLGPSKL